MYFILGIATQIIETTSKLHKAKNKCLDYVLRFPFHFLRNQSYFNPLRERENSTLNFKSL